MPEIIYNQAEPLSPAEFKPLERRMYPVSTFCRITRITSSREDLQNRQDRLKNPLQGAYPQEKDRKRNAKAVHFGLLSGRQNTLFARDLFHSGQQGRDIRNKCSKE